MYRGSRHWASGGEDGAVLRAFRLPDVLAGTVGQARADGLPGPAPRPSASVLLIEDDAPCGVRVFMFRRTALMRFAPGMLVFPGGAVDPGDADLAAAGPDDLDERRVAAVRETFEECGILLAVPVHAGEPEQVEAGEMAELRADLLADRIGLVEVLRRTHRRLDPALLHPWARWVTPLHEPRRFDTTFYVAALPVGQRVGHVAGEGEDAQWRRPAEAIAQARAGRLALLSPTLVCLEELDGARDVGQVLSRDRAVGPVRPRLVAGCVHPTVEVDLDGRGGGEPLEDPGGPSLAAELGGVMGAG